MLPTGTVTFLFTDIEGSTKLWEAYPEAMRTALARHDVLMRETIVSANGHVFKTVGDAFCAAFAMAPDAVLAALRVQTALNTESWPEETPIKVRMALHTGTVETRDGDYFGPPLNRVARLLPIGYGGQTLLSQTTYLLSRDSLPDAVSLRDLGAHRLKDLALPELVYELQDPGLPGDFPPLKSLSTHPNNLPQQLTSLIGREKEIAEIGALLVRTRLLTLTGSGGSGKTRLGLQAAAESLERFPDGAWFVELASLSAPDLVPQTVATVLGVTEEPGKPIIQTLTEHLKNKRLLLLLDNCEHLLEACAKAADMLVHQCPGVHILASSREALGIEGEQAYRVPSLSLPDRKQAQTLQTLSTYESVQLFIDRALLVRAGFQITNQNAPALASVCCHLDGIPLAIELAAARVRSLSVEEIDGRLDHRFRLLTGRSRTALPRHRTLRALIDWSYDLLNEHEQRLLQRLSVFAGGWTLAAAEQVCVGDGVADGEILDLLTSLSDKSLATAEQNDGHSRYRLLETVRQYAREKLVESGGGEAIRERHRDYFLALAEAAGAKQRGAEQAEWLRHLEEEHENLRAGLEWSLVEAGSSGGLRLCGALQWFWTTRGHLSEGRMWCVRILGKAGAQERTLECAKALNAAGVLAYLQGDYRAAREVLEKSLAIMRELGDRSGIALSLNSLGNVACEQGDFGLGRALHEETLAIRRELGDRWGVAVSLNNLGNLACDQGDFASARAPLEESLAILRELGDRASIAAPLNNLGEVAGYQGDFIAARSLFEESLSIYRELGDRSGIALLLNNLGVVASNQGEFVTARSLFEGSLANLRELENQGNEVAFLLEGLAAVVAALASSLRAARIWGAAERMREEIGSPLPPNVRPRYERSVASARAASEEEGTFDRAWQEGRALTLDQAIALALEETVEQP
jgi:predicted ATPase/class 3 adenylate cyclase/Tfp pilus assembly protein PilF